MYRVSDLTSFFPDLICSLSTTICLTFTGYCSQAEAKQNNGSVFRRNLLNRLQQEFKNREEMRKCSLQEWVCFVTFICNIFDYLKVICLSLSFGIFKHRLLGFIAGFLLSPLSSLILF